MGSAACKNSLSAPTTPQTDGDQRKRTRCLISTQGGSCPDNNLDNDLDNNLDTGLDYDLDYHLDYHHDNGLDDVKQECHLTIRGAIAFVLHDSPLGTTLTHHLTTFHTMAYTGSDSDDGGSSDIEYIGTKPGSGPSNADAHPDVEQVERSMLRITISPTPRPFEDAQSRKRKLELDVKDGRARPRVRPGKPSVRIVGEPFKTTKGPIISRDGRQEKGEETLYVSVQAGERTIKVSRSV